MRGGESIIPGEVKAAGRAQFVFVCIWSCHFNGFQKRQISSPGSLGNQLYAGKTFKNFLLQEIYL